MINGIVTAVPRNVVDNASFQTFDAKKTAKITGIYERRWIHHSQNFFHLAEPAALELLKSLNWKSSEIDVLIVVTQTPMFSIPTTACFMQWTHALNLPKNCICLDVNLGCSGYVYGLYMMERMLLNGQKGLLIVGDVLSKILNVTDQATAPIFGDAVSATGFQKVDNHLGITPVYKFGVDGERYEAVLQRKSTDRLAMDGGAIFNFVQTEIPNFVRGLLNDSATTMETIDYFIFHQANQSILNLLEQKLKIHPAKALRSISKYGNTSSASIPLTLCLEGPATFKGRDKRLCLVGFGSGASWAGTVQNSSTIKELKLIEVG